MKWVFETASKNVRSLPDRLPSVKQKLTAFKKRIRNKWNSVFYALYWLNLFQIQRSYARAGASHLSASSSVHALRLA